MLEVFTIGGGEYIVNVMNAVAAWTGGGGFRSMLQVTLVIGFAYVLLVVAFSLNWKAWFSWFLSSTLMYMALIVPTTSVKVTDRINPSLAPSVVANVPIGLAAIASFSSQIGDWLTQQAETVFVMPDALEYRTNGMIYGARLYDKTRDFKFRDPKVRANLTEYFKQCLFYDFLLGQKDPSDVLESTDILSDMGPGSPARAMTFWKEDGTTDIYTCQSSYNTLANATGIPAATDEELTKTAPSFFPDLTASAAKAKLEADLPEVSAQFHGSGQSASQIFQQRALTDAFLEARANLSSADGDTFAMMRAETQAKNTYTTIAQQAMTWVPLLNIVLTVVFYAMFPVIFPLFLFPQTGVGALKGYLTGFFYLAAWGPLYAVLHMFIMGREESAMAAAAPGGFKMSTMEGIDAVNGDTATIAGFMMMSIPFLAAGLARGAMAVSTQATSMLAPAQAAAEAAAAERTTGNYSYGNQSFQNLTGNVVQRDHWNTAPSFTAGAGMMNYVNENGTKYGVAADGTVIYDNRPGMSNLGFSASMMSSTMGEKSQAASEIESYRRGLQHEMSDLLSYGQRRGFSVSSGSRYSSGTETASGVRLGAGTSEALTNSKGRTDQLTQGRDISQGADSNRVSSDLYRDQTAAKLGVSAEVGVPRLGGGKRAGSATPSAEGAEGAEGAKTGVGRRIAQAIGGSSKAGVNGSYGKETSDGVQLSTNSTSSKSDRSTSSASESNRSGEEHAKSSRTSEDQFDSTTNTDRSESFHGVTLTQDEYQDRVRSIADRMTEAEEVQRSLGTTFTAREGGGLQASNDLSQIIASRYADYANSERFRGIAPSLQSTDLTPAQMRARQLIVDEIGKDYIEEIMAPVREHMVSPMEGHDPLPGPGDFSRADLSRAPGGGGGRGVSRPKLDTEGYRDKVGDQIDEGGKSLDASRSAAERSRSSSVIGASDLNQKVDDQLDRRWFEEKGRNR